MRILVTNDDGVDAIGLHVLARRLVGLGDVVIAAPDREYSGAGAALGTLHLIRPEVRRVDLDGVPEAWSVTGPPALCVMFARLGVFGERVRPRRVRHQPRRQLRPGDLPLGHRRRRAHRSERRCLRARGEPGRRRLRRRGPGLGRDAQRPALGHGRRGRRPRRRVDARATSRTDPVVLNVNVPNRPLDQLAGLAPHRGGPAAAADARVGPAHPQAGARRRLRRADGLGRPDRAAG